MKGMKILDDKGKVAGGDQTDEPKAPEKVQLPPIRVFKVTRIKPGAMRDPLLAQEVEEILVPAHRMSIEGDHVLSFVLFVATNGGTDAMVTTPRAFQSWEDCEEILKTDGQVH